MATQKIILTSDPQRFDVTDMGLRIQSTGKDFRWCDSPTKPAAEARDVCVWDRDVFINGPRTVWVWADTPLKVSIT